MTEQERQCVESARAMVVIARDNQLSRFEQTKDDFDWQQFTNMDMALDSLNQIRL